MLPFARRPGFPCSGTPASRHGPNRRTCLTAKRAPGRRVLLPGPHAMISIHNFVILNEVNRCSPQTQRPLADFAERTRRRSQVNSAYRCLTALRLSLSSLLGRVRKRPLRSLRSSIRSARHVICGGCRTDAGTSAKQGGEQRGQTSVQAESGIFQASAREVCHSRCRRCRQRDAFHPKGPGMRGGPINRRFPLHPKRSPGSPEHPNFQRKPTPQPRKHPKRRTHPNRPNAENTNTRKSPKHPPAPDSMDPRTRRATGTPPRTEGTRAVRNSTKKRERSPARAMRKKPPLPPFVRLTSARRGYASPRREWRCRPT